MRNTNDTSRYIKYEKRNKCKEIRGVLRSKKGYPTSIKIIHNYMCFTYIFFTLWLGIEMKKVYFILEIYNT